MPPVTLAVRILRAGWLYLTAEMVGTDGEFSLVGRHVLHEGASLQKRINPPAVYQPTLESPRQRSRRACIINCSIGSHTRTS